MRLLQGSLPFPRTWWTGYAAGLTAVALVTLLIGLVEGYRHVSNISMLYLLAVLTTASAFGSGPAIVASLTAFLAFDWFFVHPQHTLTVADPAEWIALVLFLLTAASTGQLAAGQRARADEAKQREREASVFYELVLSLSQPDLNQALAAVAERLRKELRLAAVVIALDDPAGGGGLVATAGKLDAVHRTHAVGASTAVLMEHGATPTKREDAKHGRWVRIIWPRSPRGERGAVDDRLHIVPIKAQQRRLGVLRLLLPRAAPKFSATDDRLLSAVAAQLGMALERAQLRHEATEAEVIRRSDELKTALLNAISHDLRTPLASIVTTAGSLRQRGIAWTEDERQEMATSIESEAQRLDRILRNLLDLSRLRADSLRPDLGWYDLGQLVDDVLGRLRPLISQHQLLIAIPETLPPVPMDYVEIDQVLSNLVENAAKYTSPGTEIRIIARQADGEVEVEVADRGPGIPAQALPRLFEPFFRVESRGPRPHGTGLGLAVAKGLIEVHGGRLWVENRSGGGVRFVFRLPLAAPADQALATGDGEDDSPRGGTHPGR